MRLSMRPSRVFSSYAAIPPDYFTRRGVTLLLTDLDFTLAPKSQQEPDDGLRRWLAELKAAGITVMILSNNRSPVRVERFCRDLGISYEGHAGKPSVKGFRRAMARQNVTAAQTAMLGDKLLTDMLGANLAGVLPVMVEPLGGAVTAWQKVLHGLQRPWKALAWEKCD